jgi:hypothetical protein
MVVARSITYSSFSLPSIEVARHIYGSSIEAFSALDGSNDERVARGLVE